MDYAEKAAASAGAALSGALIVRLIRLNLRAGRDTESTEFHQLLLSLKQANQWTSDNLLDMAEEAQNDGYYDQAQIWMREAIDMNPERLNLKRRRLEMAIASESEGQISLSLEKAIESPTAEVMDPLRESGSIQDAFSAIELFEQNGEHEMAISALLSVLPWYVEAHGVISSKNMLNSLSEKLPTYRAKAADILAKSALIGETPCDALAYASDISDPVVWGMMLNRCKDAGENIISNLRDLRSGMSRQYKTSFDESVYKTLIDAQNAEAAILYAEEMGLQNTAFEHFERIIKAGDTLSALKQLAHDDVEPIEIKFVVSELASRGYTREAVDYLRSEMPRIPDTERAMISGAAILLGANDDIFLSSLMENGATGISDLTDIETSRTVSVQMIEKWLAETPTTQMSYVMNTAMTCASMNPDLHDGILNAVKMETDRRNSKRTLYMTAALAAADKDLHQDALKFLESLRQILPGSDYVHRMISAEQAILGDEKGAWRSLEEGARCTDQLGNYWTRAAEMHVSSGIQLRKNINSAQREIQPHRADLLASAAALELEAGNIEMFDLLAKNFDKFEQKDMTLLMNHINSTRRQQLGGRTPFELADSEAFRELKKVLGLEAIPADEVNLTPRLLKKAAGRQKIFCFWLSAKQNPWN